jgi:hypothetical protein
MAVTCTLGGLGSWIQFLKYGGAFQPICKSSFDQGRTCRLSRVPGAGGGGGRSGPFTVRCTFRNSIAMVSTPV